MRRRQAALILCVSLLAYSLFFSFAVLRTDFQTLFPLDPKGIGLFTILLILVASFPIVIKGTNIVLIQAVTVAVFLQYGLLVEMILSQLSVFYLLFIRFRSRDWRRYCLNGTMILLTSVGSALVFMLLGGEMNASATSNKTPIVPILGYVISNILINHTLLYLIQNKLLQVKKEWFGPDFWWEVIPLAIILPTGILIHELYRNLGSMAILYVMIPIVSFSMIFKLYNRLENMNKKLKIINQTSHSMKGKLDVQQVLRDFGQAVEELVNYEYLYVYKVDEQRQQLELIYGIDRSVAQESKIQLLSASLPIGAGLSGIVAETGKSIRIGFQRKAKHFQQELELLHHRRKQNSILSFPLIRHDQLIGVVTLSHSDSNRYTKEDVRLAEILASQAGIALRNADKFEQTKRKSEMDELTGLYNYRYFEHLLFTSVRDAQEKQETLALILLDIDHFKSINDRYGHLVGNRVLFRLAEILSAEIQDLGMVTRYGGEEFTILLPSIDQEQALKLAEGLRYKVEHTPISLEAGLELEQLELEKREVSITVSVGVSVFPTDADDALSLVRHADRAMYMGAKQKGRNKVAAYRTG